MTTNVPAELERKMDEAIGHYPAEQKRSAALPLLHLWQEHFGFISDEGVSWIAAKLGLEPINILELVTFYPMFRQAPAGRKHIRVCRTLSCAMAGSYQLMEKLAAAGEYRSRPPRGGMHTPVAVSPDGEYSIEFVECLASCGTAPVCMVDDELLNESIRTRSQPFRPFTIHDSRLKARPLLRNRYGTLLAPSARAPSDFQKHRAARATPPTSIVTCKTAATSSLKKRSK